MFVKLILNEIIYHYFDIIYNIIRYDCSSIRLIFSRKIIVQSGCLTPIHNVNRFHTPAEYKLIDTYDCVSIDVAGYSGAFRVPGVSHGFRLSGRTVKNRFIHGVEFFMIVSLKEERERKKERKQMQIFNCAIQLFPMIRVKDDALHT